MSAASSASELALAAEGLVPTEAGSTALEPQSDSEAKIPLQLPTLSEVDAEIDRVNGQQRRHRIWRNTLVVVATVFAVSVLLSLYVMPMFRIYGSSMSPTLSEGDVVVGLKGSDASTGDLIAFSYNNKLLTKRVIAGPGDWVDISSDGTVSVNGQTLDESYLPQDERALGQCDISLPYQVPENHYFVMGDNRSISIDSRSSQMGAIANDQVVGKLNLRIWPLNRFGGIGG